MGLEALVVLLFFLLPGLIADSLFRLLLWRRSPSKEDRLLRGLYFSAGGLLVLLAVGFLPFLDGDLPEYLFPAWWVAAQTADQSIVRTVFRSWGGHTIASVLVALLLVFILSRPWTARTLQKFVKQSLFESVWQEFAERYFEQWAVVSTTSGRQFYGQLGTISGRDDKDIILLNPAAYEPTGAGEIISVAGTEAMFIPENQVAQIEVSYPSDEIAAKRSLFGRYFLATRERIG